jgi:catechol 2,3-dioxygenase-like lactoylglutathione lyase family enzyme
MIDHIGVAVSDIGKSRAFYEAALRPLGLKIVASMTPDQTHSGGTAIGFGRTDNNGFFWIADQERPGQGTHVALAVERRDQVDEFHKAALAAGGGDNGAPGLRPQYRPNYYAAFVLDPDGLNLEAVCYAER